MRLLLRVFTSLVLLGLCLATVPAAAQHKRSAPDDAHVLVLGRISDDPKSHYDQLKPLLDYVVPRMRDVGIREGRILMARDLQQMASYLRRGRVDWVTETSGNALLLSRRTGAQPILLTERRGVSHYRTIFFTRRDSGVQQLADLKGRSVAFQHPYSTSAYYVPASELLARGMQLELLLSPMDQPSPERVGYMFGRTELNVATWVAKGLVDVGVLSNLDWDNQDAMPQAFRKDLVVIADVAPVPRGLELVCPDMAPQVRARLREVLLEAAADPDAGEALRRFFGTSRFLPLDAVTKGQLRELQRRVERVRAEVE